MKQTTKTARIPQTEIMKMREALRIAEIVIPETAARTKTVIPMNLKKIQSQNIKTQEII